MTKLLTHGEVLTKIKTLLQQLSYSCDLSSADIFLFPELQLPKMMLICISG
jgi:hypothetical protein